VAARLRSGFLPPGRVSWIHRSTARLICSLGFAPVACSISRSASICAGSSMMLNGRFGDMREYAHIRA